MHFNVTFYNKNANLKNITLLAMHRTLLDCWQKEASKKTTIHVLSKTDIF